MKTTVKITALAGIAALITLGACGSSSDSSEESTTEASQVETAPEPTPEPEPEPVEETTTRPAPAPRPTPEPVEEETFTPPDAGDDLARIVLDSVWRDTTYTDRQDMCLLYNLSPSTAWDAFSGGDEDTVISRNVFDEHFTEEC